MKQVEGAAVISPPRSGCEAKWREWGFVALMVLALIKPADLPNLQYYLGVAVFGLVAGWFVSSVLREGHWRIVWERYPLEGFLAVGLLVVYAVSLLIHLDAYPGWFEILTYGAPSIILMSLFLMAWTVFSKNGGSGLYGPGLALLIVVQGVAIMQALSPQTVDWLTRYSVAVDAMHYPGMVSSLFRWHTIYGSVAALVSVYGIGMVVFGKLRPGRGFWFVVLIGLSLLGGTLSESRNFLFTLLAGLLVLGVHGARKRPLPWAAAIVAALVAFHITAWLSPGVARDYGKALPYIGKLTAPATIEPRDFVPVWSSHSLSNRPAIWTRGAELAMSSPWVGIGPGVFRLESGIGKVHNLHNLFLQVLVDTGIVGFGVFVVLLGRIFWRIRDPVVMAVFGGMVATHLFDNFFDYSMGFVLVAAWLLAGGGRVASNARNF